MLTQNIGGFTFLIIASFGETDNCKMPRVFAIKINQCYKSML